MSWCSSAHLPLRSIIVTVPLLYLFSPENGLALTDLLKFCIWVIPVGGGWE